jgi:hypothetical protein
MIRNRVPSAPILIFRRTKVKIRLNLFGIRFYTVKLLLANVKGKREGKFKIRAGVGTRALSHYCSGSGSIRMMQVFLAAPAKKH